VQFQAHCTWEMWNAVMAEGGEQQWMEWFSRLFIEGELALNKRSQSRIVKKLRKDRADATSDDVRFLGRGTVQTLHKV
jgi:hypothetical protein